MVAAETIVKNINDLIINPIILVLFAAGLFFFVYGLVEFLWNLRGGEVDNRGKEHMLWGIVGMLVMASTYSILLLILNTFGINRQSATDTSNIQQVLPNVRF